MIDAATVTILSDAEEFSGRVVLKNGSTVTLAAGSFVAVEWVVEAGSVLNLGGQTVTVAEIGGDGCVSNGTLVVTERVTPGVNGQPGTLAVKGGLAAVREIVALCRASVRALTTGTLTVAEAAR